MTSSLLPTKAAIQQLARDIDTVLQQAGVPRVSWNMEGKLEQEGYQISSTHWDHVGLWYCDESRSREYHKTEIHRIQEILGKYIQRCPIVRLEDYWYQLIIEMSIDGYGLPSMAVNVAWVPKPRRRDKLRYMFKLGRLSRR